MPLDTNDTRQALRAAIRAHGIWKQRLRTSVAVGRPDLDPAVVGSACACDFGQWLKILPAEVLQAAHVRRVVEHHDAFHAAAADVARLTQAGKKADAEAVITQGPFHEAESQLVAALADWLRRA